MQIDDGVTRVSFQAEEPNLLPSLVRLLDGACQELEGDRDNVKFLLTKATSLIRVEIDRLRIEVLPEMKTGGLATWQIRRLKAYVDTRLERRIPLKELSAVLKLSPTYFCRVFKRTFHETPQKYVVRRRIDKAEMLMLTTDMPLSEIAIRCGLGDQAHFCRTFRRKHAQTPATWRRERTEHRLRGMTAEAAA
ncbi:MAG: AraC family transcriptional regulator [Rhizomicrobium sp.]